MTLLAGAPLLWWMRKYVTAHGWSLREVFGLQWPSGGFRQVWKVVLVLVGLSVAGEFVMSVIVSVCWVPAKVRALSRAPWRIGARPPTAERGWWKPTHLRSIVPAAHGLG